MHNQGLADRDLAVFLAGTPETDAYLHDLWWAQAYALLNRAVILQEVCDELTHRIDGIGVEGPSAVTTTMWLWRPATMSS